LPIPSGSHSPGIQPIHYGFHLDFFNVLQEAGLLLARLTVKFGKAKILSGVITKYELLLFCRSGFKTPSSR
jgi:hypothetical protein